MKTPKTDFFSKNLIVEKAINVEKICLKNRTRELTEIGLL